MAIFCDGSSPAITSCVFAGGQGTAVYSINGRPTFEACHFVNNQSVETPTCIVAVSAVLRDCTFIGNFNDDAAGAASIGQAFIYNCVFSDNSTHLSCGSLRIGPGSVVEDTSISGWAKYHGAAVCAGGPVIFRRCSIGRGATGGPALSVSGCITLQDTPVSEEEIYPPGACVRVITSKAIPETPLLSQRDGMSWGSIKSLYR